MLLSEVGVEEKMNAGTRYRMIAMKKRKRLQLVGAAIGSLAVVVSLYIVLVLR